MFWFKKNFMYFILTPLFASNMKIYWKKKNRFQVSVVLRYLWSKPYQELLLEELIVVGFISQMFLMFLLPCLNWLDVDLAEEMI